jgi:hypothetical protein
MISTAKQQFQLVRPVYSPLHGYNYSLPRSESISIPIHYDSVSNLNVILWGDILSIFKGVKYIREGSRILPFLRGQDLKQYVISQR